MGRSKKNNDFEFNFKEILLIFQPTCANKDQCLIEITPREGTLFLDKPCPIEIIFIPQQCGELSDDWHIPCYIQNASQPVFLKLSAIMKGMNVEFRHEQK